MRTAVDGQVGVTTFEVELEREKAGKIAEMADRGAAMAAELGQDPDAVRVFLTHYFRHVDAVDVDARPVDDLLGLVESHYRAALQRPAARATVTVRAPSQSADGWTAGGATVVQVVTDDHPFLVDSVTIEVLRQGWSIREVFHPQFLVHRDVAGELVGVLRGAEAEGDPSVLRESWMHLEILPPSRSERSGEEAAEALRRGLLEVLRLVEEAVEDWERMIARSEETRELLTDTARTGGRTAEAAQARELLAWFNDSHFTFLGYREYVLDRSGAEVRFDPVPATGLGILRADQDPPDTFHARPQPGTDQPLMVITKDDDRSRVHRPAYLDYIGIRTFAPGSGDERGAGGAEVVGERRFLGLFASSAYSESVPRIPVLRQKAAEVLLRSGYDEQSHGGKAVLDVLDSYPRDELFQARVAELAPVVETVAHLKERRQVRLFVRRDGYGRYLSCLVYLPRDRYTTTVRARMQDILLSTLGGASVDYTARVTESVLARLHFVVRMPTGRPVGEVDVRELEKQLTLATRSWDDGFADQLAGSEDAGALAALVGALPEGYKEDYAPAQAVLDLRALAALAADGDMSMSVYAADPDSDADLRLKVFRRGAALSLSTVLPHLAVLGVEVIDERPYELQPGGDRRAFVYDFGLTVTGGSSAAAEEWTRPARERFLAAFAASYSGRSEPDAFNALVMRAGLDWQQVAVLRLVGRYLRQAGSTYSQTYIAQALSANVDLARLLSVLFETRFDPRNGLDLVARQAAADTLVARAEAALEDVSSLDHDRIIRSYLAVVRAMVRTNAFQPGRQAVAVKLLPRQVPDLPEPRPAYEIFVYSPRVEGVHLRFGTVARGGLRWSDRAEDFRTEVLGLVKAQMVKNSVIVPVGAKGGFFCKTLPDPVLDRDGWLAEGVACYQLFITSLLDLTDNLVQGDVVPPVDVVRYDGDDPYLVVAADKGTATFSDIANEISTSAGFWLGDAFASGGSAGYDHKVMGITARGAWESVVRHFRELGVDCQTTDFSCVGIGDMSGDVFGNGMLLSRHTRLVAAFDHRHVFVDPHPDPERSWTERARMFALPRSSWADYDPSLVSAGGGVFPRSLKSVAITPQMHEVLGIDPDVVSLSPAELITACLRAPVDLLWNGGIGTYVKAATETSADVGDKANDVLRVDGGDLRARVVGEGGNLGLTQLGRVEYAAQGGRINTDFIDNSAGVDTSDHEVNIKILLESEVAAGRLPRADRDGFLASMTDEVAELVLAHNRGQNLALANSVHQAAAMAGVHEDWMQRLEGGGLLDRRLESLPSSDELAARRLAGSGLTSPELCTLMAYTKIVLETEVLASDLPDDPYLARRLVDYFPTAMRSRYAGVMPGHRLHREIITTSVVNAFVDQSGITSFHRLSGETGATAADVIRAQVAARAVFGVRDDEVALAALDHRVEADTQTRLRLELRTLVERATRWVLDSRGRPVDVELAVGQLAEGVQRVRQELPRLLSGRDAEAYQARLRRLREADVPDDVAVAAAVWPVAPVALTVVQLAHRDGLDLLQVARVHLRLAQHLGLDRLQSRIVELPREDRWQTMARAALRADLSSVHAQLTSQVLAGGREGTPEELVAAWERTGSTVRSSVASLRSVCQGGPDLARMSVGLRIVRGLLPSAG